ncbi:MAG: FAD-dependent oxidoreductase [Rhodospirillaceae bacterium]|nr:FAD-dependent oxidoreductase [Rhodospirillaceae bacterium]|tara:strand:+ start:180 stop:1544 length:1365 start_codon:yes stop_codon:yes gene_type:complete
MKNAKNFEATVPFDIKKLPIVGNFDVVVVGGGAAGVSAATNLAELGHNTLLVERYGFCGGGAVAGMSGTICGLFLSTDQIKNIPEQVVFGFAERFRYQLNENGGLTQPQKYGKTWTVTHDPLVWRETADEFLRASGVHILFHTRVVGVLTEDANVCGIIVDTKSGFGMIKSKIVVDASGDADVVHRAGWPSTKGRDGVMQNPTMIFRVGGVDVKKFKGYWGEDTISPQHVVDEIISADESGKFYLPRKKIWIFPTTRQNELLVNATRIMGIDGRDLDVTDPNDHTEAELNSRKQIRQYAGFLKDCIPGCQDSYIVDSGVEVGIRQTRSIAGLSCLKNSDVMGRKKISDGVVRCPWPIELHSGEKPRVEWLLDDYYEIPLGALIPKEGENIIVAGRCLSAEHEALASARVTAQCFGYGHAVAIACDLALNKGVNLRDIAGEEVRYHLNEQGAQLD